MPICKLVGGVGLYERGRFLGKIDGKITKEYELWNTMLQRCRPGGRIQSLHPTYIGCSVHPDFIKFQDFAEWCQTQIGFGLKDWQLDKDILIQDNKVYGPDTCCFVPRQLNAMLSHQQSNQGLYPGVRYRAAKNVYYARMKSDGRDKHIGSYTTPEAARTAYVAAKSVEIKRQAEIWKSQIDPRVFDALMTYKV